MSLIKNWRHILLTNSDYKLQAKCLPLSLSPVIHDIINTDQVGGITGRSVSLLLRLTDDVIHQLNVSQKPGLLITVGYFRAFDCIAKGLMLKVCERFGFGGDFVKWVSVLMRCKKLCELLSMAFRLFALESRIRQDVLFSPLAFVLSVELLILVFRENCISL